MDDGFDKHKTAQHSFDRDYWEAHWQTASERSAGWDIVANPHLAREVSSLVPGTALEAGCGEGAEAIWLAGQGWQVTAADISAEALSRASVRAVSAGANERIEWVEADLSVWEPGQQFDLVTTHYAHPAMPQLAFYERIADWVAPGGTLLIVGHLHRSGTTDHQHGNHPPEEASVSAASVALGLDAARWDVVTAEERSRKLTSTDGHEVELHDVIVRATSA